MHSDIIGTTSANGYPFLGLEDRLALYEKCGFGSVMLWWGGDELVPRGERVALAHRHRLRVENVHSDPENSNALWLPGALGDQKAAEHIAAVKDCRKFGVLCMVMHLTSGASPPEISDIGLKRLESIFDCAAGCGVTIAIENVRTPEHIRCVFDRYRDDCVGFCYDSGHANVWCRDVDWLALYGRRLCALHLHDNNSRADTHDIPFTGATDWKKLMGLIRESAYRGSLTLETEYGGGHDIAKLEEFLRASYQSGLKLAAL